MGQNSSLHPCPLGRVMHSEKRCRLVYAESVVERKHVLDSFKGYPAAMKAGLKKKVKTTWIRDWSTQCYENLLYWESFQQLLQLLGEDMNGETKSQACFNPSVPRGQQKKCSPTHFITFNTWKGILKT